MRKVHQTYKTRAYSSCTAFFIIIFCGALKTRSCSGLHSGIVHALEVFDSWIVHAWSLKNKELFQIGLVGRPRVEP